MSASTLPKSVQAQMRDQSDEESDDGTNCQDIRRRCRELNERLSRLPEDFLRFPASSLPPQEQTIANIPRPLASRDHPMVDMLEVSVVEAQLLKNYGILRMDLYCKIRVAHMVCETQTCLNGAKNPKWEGVYQFTLKPGMDTFHLEIYDDRQFSPDEKIAWLSERIPPEIFQGITVERWFPLSGRLGPNKEGSVLIVLSHKRAPARGSNLSRHPPPIGPLTVLVPAPNQGPIVMGGGMSAVAQTATQIPAYVQAEPVAQPGAQQPLVGQDQTPVVVSEQDIDQLSEMFPSINRAVIREVLENNHNDKESAIGALLALG